MNGIPTNEPGENGLDRALRSVTEVLGKTDVKAGGLFAADVGLAALIRGALAEGPVVARAAAGGSAFSLAIAIVFLMLAYLPRLRDDGNSFPHWAELTPEEIREAVREDVRPQQVGILARLAKTKFRRLQAACVATGLAGLLLIAADLLSAV
ncbi:Pycsar system effector family protein [Streptomyces sp. NPDC049555]|uniref:Pycsar system effector family protein n=1 Tax=Streptomyces sp. NPDC049555 TaxID=3154930 RepID=UPI00343C8947